MIARFRQREMSLMRSTCRITRGGSQTFDPDVGSMVPDDDDVDPIYEGKCTIRSFIWEGASTQAGEREVRLRGARLKLPKDTPTKKDDVVTVLTSEHDAGLPGKTFRVTDVYVDDYQIVRVAVMQEVT